MTILLRQGLCDGEIVEQVSQYSRSHRRHPQGRSERYRHTGQIDTATGYPIFVYTPPRSKLVA
jgi:hypothetical protein